MIRAQFLALVALTSIAALRPEDKDLEHIKNFALLTTFQVRTNNIDSNTETTTEIVHIRHTEKPDPKPANEATKPDEVVPITSKPGKPYPVPFPVYVRVPIYVREPGLNLREPGLRNLQGLIGSYVPSKAGGTYRAGFNMYQTVEYRKTW